MRKSSKIAAAGRWSIYASVAGLFASGMVLAWEPGSQAPVWEPALQGFCRQVHGALAMLALIGLGSLAGHISTGWGRRKNIPAGALMLGILSLLSVSAWLLYYAGPGALHDGASRAHTWSGYFLVPMLLVHVRVGRSGR